MPDSQAKKRSAQIRKMGKPDEHRLVTAIVKSNGVFTNSSRASWAIFAARDLLPWQVIQELPNGAFVPGPEFENYLIAQNLAVVHLAWRKYIMSESAVIDPVLSKDVIKSAAAWEFQANFDQLNDIYSKVSLLGAELVHVLSCLNELFDSIERVEALLDVHITGGDQVD